jgi:AcrR family transcriptional regulator
MARISKPPEERKEEILITAQKLFLEKSFAGTKISDIAKTIGVSQGIFYYYFTSKEAVIDEIVRRYIDKHIAAVRPILTEGNLNPVQKLEKMAAKQFSINRKDNNNIHAIKGVDMHDKILKGLIQEYVPLMVQAFGKTEDYKAVYLMEIFVASANILFDPGIFRWKKKEMNSRILSLISFMEHSLEVPEGSLSFYKNLMGFKE